MFICVGYKKMDLRLYSLLLCLPMDKDKELLGLSIIDF